MAQSFKEKAHLNIDQEKYNENYDRIFKKKNDNCPECDREQCWGGSICMEIKNGKLPRASDTTTESFTSGSINFSDEPIFP